MSTAEVLAALSSSFPKSENVNAAYAISLLASIVDLLDTDPSRKETIQKALEGHPLDLEALRLSLIRREEDRVTRQVAILTDPRMRRALASVLETKSVA